MVPAIVLILAISGIILGASVITIAEFGETVTTCFNTSYVVNDSASGTYMQGDYCNAGRLPVGSAGPSGTNLTNEFYALTQSQDGLQTVGEQQPVLAIIAVMVIIISVLAGTFVYFRFFR